MGTGREPELKEGDTREWDLIQEKERGAWEPKLRGRRARRRPGAPPPREASGCRRARLRFRGNGGRRKALAGGLGAGWERLAVGQQQHAPPCGPGAALRSAPAQLQ